MWEIRMPLRHAFIATLFTALLAPALYADLPAPGHADTIPIQLHRPFKPGESYDVHFIFEKRTLLTPLATPVKAEPSGKLFQIDLTCRISNVTLDDKGFCQKFTLAIAHLLDKGNDSIRPGTILNVALVAGENPDFSGTPKSALPDNARPLLNYVLNAYFPGHQKLDAALGASQPQAIDAEWKTDSTVIAPFLTEDLTFSFKPFNVKGASKITIAKDSAGTSIRRFTATVNCNDFAPPEADKLVLIEKSGGTYQYTATLPADPAAPLPEEERLFDSSTNYTTPDSRVRVNRTFHRSLKTTVAVVKRTGVP